MRGYLEDRGKPFWGLTAAILLVLIGFVEYTTGTEFSLTVFYLLPVGICVWFISSRFGLFMSIASACSTWLIADYSSGISDTSYTILVWNTLHPPGFIDRCFLPAVDHPQGIQGK